MTSRPPADRRVSNRAPIELKVEYKRLNTFFADYTKNISKGGTFIRTDKPLEVGTEFIFALAVPGVPAPLRLLGKVQWAVRPGADADEGPPGMGIEFLYQSDQDRRVVADVVEELMVRELGEALAARLLGRGAGGLRAIPLGRPRGGPAGSQARLCERGPLRSAAAKKRSMQPRRAAARAP